MLVRRCVVVETRNYANRCFRADTYRSSIKYHRYVSMQQKLSLEIGLDVWKVCAKQLNVQVKYTFKRPVEVLAKPVNVTPNSSMLQFNSFCLGLQTEVSLLT